MEHKNEELFSQENVTDNLAAILERANRKLQEEIVPFETLTHRQAILEQRLRLFDEALKKLSSQQLRLGIDSIPKEDLIKLLEAGHQEHNPHASDEAIRLQVQSFLSSL